MLQTGSCKGQISIFRTERVALRDLLGRSPTRDINNPVERLFVGVQADILHLMVGRIVRSTSIRIKSRISGAGLTTGQLFKLEKHESSVTVMLMGPWPSQRCNRHQVNGSIGRSEIAHLPSTERDSR